MEIRNYRAAASKEPRRIYGLGDVDWTIEVAQRIPLSVYRERLGAAIVVFAVDRLYYGPEAQ